ncbi:hypothetical protein DYB30_008418 [Aphanomyces astaci]|uniref:Nuclear nucleic acid-binding protein C1D n=1 Tax=Aphanomyces astaci TaxID=112090 RepID=A0A397EC71_APHAT|nr:hypothetical protein DYB34_013839 [Aphanomyces astaci]RHY77412.1 hypothetical protein DYB38_006682 [Aphanomyces astaci]RHY78744.1 hypothetical protein DYB30_008418 [Aphanomyces astaci]RHZ06442.1 hypothetical protein DYB26_004308 [Aphanomyces astaci]
MDSRLENLDNALGAVEEYLDVLTTKPVDELTTELAPIDKAKVQVGLGRQIRVDAEAAGRFINHALSSDQVYAEAASAATTDIKATDSAKKAPSTKKKNKASDKSTAAKSTTDTPPKKRARK